MSDVEEPIKEALEALRAKELLFRRETATLELAATALAEALLAGRTLHVFGEGSLAPIARYVVHRFFEAEGGATLRASALGLDPAAALRETRTFVERGDALLALAREGARGLAGQVVETARARGAATIVLTGYPGEGFADRAQVLVTVPSRREPVVVEGVLAAAHILERLIAKRLGLEPAAPQGTAPAAGEKDKDLLASSGEAVVAELVEQPASRQRNPGSSVEMVALASDAQPIAAGEAPALIRFKCGTCGGQIQVEARYAGRRGQCPECLSEYTIPSSADPNASAGGRSGHAPRHGHGAGHGPSGSGARRGDTGSRTGSVAPPPPSQERRRANRVTVADGRIAFALDAFPGENQPPVYHELEDLSLTGLSFTVKSKGGAAPAAEVKVGDSLFMHLDFPIYVDKVRVQGEVRRVGMLPDRSGLAVGVRFSRFLDDAQAKVRKLVENSQLRGVKRR